MPSSRPARSVGTVEFIMGSVLATVLFTATACGGTTAPAAAPASAPASSLAVESTNTSAADSMEDPTPLDAETVPDAGNASLAANVQPSYAATAVEVLATLPIKGRAPKTGYSREEFGQAWADVDKNGCDTRNDILDRDLADTTFKPESRECVVLTGMLADPYTATAINFVRGSTTSSAVQIDHVVALNDAWQKGAQQLSVEQRTALANDPLNLLAVDGPSNQQKGASDAATWLPPNKSFRCQYVARQVSVKATYSLWITQGEHDAMGTVLADCDNILAPTNQAAPTTAAAPAPAPAPAQAPAVPEAPAPAAPAPAVPAPAPAVPAPVPAVPAPVAPAAQQPVMAPYANCTAVRAAGAAPISVGQPGFQAKLDRDGDGVACE